MSFPFRYRFTCPKVEMTIRYCSAANFLHASSLYKPYYYGNNCNDKQNVNDASRVKCEKPNEPSNNKNDG